MGDWLAKAIREYDGPVTMKHLNLYETWNTECGRTALSYGVQLFYVHTVRNISKEPLML